MKGQKATPDTLHDVFEGLETNGLAQYDKILTGYVPGAEALEVVEKRIKAMMERSSDIVYILDRKQYRCELLLIYSGHGRHWTGSLCLTRGGPSV